MSFTHLLLENENSVAVVTLNHPPVNAISLALLNELAAALNQIYADESVRAVVITGAG